jgi:hypothetical protein
VSNASKGTLPGGKMQSGRRKMAAIVRKNGKITLRKGARIGERPRYRLEIKKEIDIA